MKKSIWVGIGWLSLVWSVQAQGPGAGPGCANCASCATSSCPGKPVKLFYIQPPPSPEHGPDVPFPSPMIFRKDLLPPETCIAPAAPPIKLFQVPQTQVHIYHRPMTEVTYCQGSMPPPEQIQGPCLRPITLFSRSPQPVTYGPNLTFPPVKLYQQQPLTPPCELGIQGCAKPTCVGQ